MSNSTESVILSENESIILNYIRRNNGNFSKAELAESLNFPWSTVSTTVSSLLQKKMIIVSKNENDKSYKGKLFINSNHKFYVGISLGHSKIKIAVLNFCLRVLEESDVQTEEHKDGIYRSINNFSACINNIKFEKDQSLFYKWCCPTPDTIPEIRETMIRLTKEIINLKVSGFNIDAIGIALPGHIDFDNQRIVRSFEEKSDGFLNTTLASIISVSLINELNDNNIKIYIDHNVKSSTIGEKEAIVTNRKAIDKGNVLNLYLGVGLSLGMVFSNSIYRGNNNMAGELGKCIFKMDNGTIFEKELNYLLYNNSEGKLADNDKAIDEFSENSNIDSFVDLLCVSLSNIVNILGIDTIIFSGKFERLFPHIELKLMNRFLKTKKTELNLIKSYYGEYSASIGCAIEAYYNAHNLPIQWNKK